MGTSQRPNRTTVAMLSGCVTVADTKYPSTKPQTLLVSALHPLNRMDSEDGIELEVRGENCVEVMQAFLKSLDVNNAVRARIELDTKETISLNGRKQYTLDETAADPESEPEPEPDDEPEQDDDDTAVEGVRYERIPTLHTNADTTEVLIALVNNDSQYWNLQQVRDLLGADSDVDKERVSSILWQLGERGLVDKQQSNESRRMYEYRPTSKGRAAVKQFQRQQRT